VILEPRATHQWFCSRGFIDRMRSGVANVYVSSTFEDLKEERACVREALVDLGHSVTSMESYGSSEERALKSCVADVQKCDLYVCIVGWRYGFVPPEGNGKSITEQEYEAAGKVPRLLYLCAQKPEEWARPPGRPDRQVDADLGQIQRFRQQLQDTHRPKLFKDLRDLSVTVTRDVERTFPMGRTEKKPELGLPYFCDRQAQRRDLSGTLDAKTRKLPVCVVEGSFDEMPDMFVACVKERLLASWLHQNGPCPEVQLPWPDDASDFRDAIVRSFSVECSQESICDTASLEAYIAQEPRPFLVTTSISVKDWGREQERVLDALLEWLDGWQNPRGPALVLIWTGYSDGKKGGWHTRLLPDKYARKKAELGSALQAQADKLRKRIQMRRLAPLGRVQLQDALLWARSDLVHNEPRPSGLELRVREIFSQEEELSMSRLAPQLFDALERK